VWKLARVVFWLFQTYCKSHFLFHKTQTGPFFEEELSPMSSSQHSVSSFRLKDPTKPGHRRFIALWLVDPYQPVISTANVPPQQLDWWLELALGQGQEERDSALSKLPLDLVRNLKAQGLLEKESEVNGKKALSPELSHMVGSYNEGINGLMTRKVAERHREWLMKERTKFAQKYRGAQLNYNFCEH
jgi:Protein of unknown function (DUF4246)